MDNSQKITVAIIASSACAAALATFYFLTKIKEKDEQISRLQIEINDLTRKIHSNLIINNLESNGKLPTPKLRRGVRFSGSEPRLNGLRRNSLRKSSECLADDMTSIYSETTSIDDEFYDTIEELTKADSCQIIIDDVKHLEFKGDDYYVEAYNLLSQYEFTVPEYICMKAKFSRYRARMEEENNNMDGAKHYYVEAHNHAKHAEQIDPINHEVQKWLAITLSDVSEYGDHISLSDRVHNALKIKAYAEACLISDSFDPLVHYLLGRWHFKIASLNWYELRTARAFCSDFPKSTYEKAMEHFREAERIQPNYFIGNMLYIAKCYIALKDEKSRALHWLKKALDLRTRNADDRKAMAEVRDILVKEFKYDFNSQT